MDDTAGNLQSIDPSLLQTEIDPCSFVFHDNFQQLQLDGQADVGDTVKSSSVNFLI
jgi:hypothetical protein